MAVRVMIVCPMTVEARGLGPVAGATIAISGPGPAAMRRWIDTVHESPALIVLVGVAGGLGPLAPLGEAGIVHQVVAPDGRRWSSSVAGRWCVAGADRLVATPEAKSALASQTGAHIVDMESHVFAELATRRAWRWAIVRGISDGGQDSLPSELESLVDAKGAARMGAAFAILARRPNLLPVLCRLAVRTTRAMAAVRPIVASLLASEAAR